MARDEIRALDGSSTSTYEAVTRTALAGNKHALDVLSVGLGGVALATEATLALVLAEMISTVGVVTAVPFSLTVQTALAVNAARKGFFAYNATNKRILVKFGSAASASSYSFSLGSGGLYERELTNYRGEITVIWDSPAAGDLLVTELT